MSKKILVIGLLISGVLAVSIYFYIERGRQLPEGLIQANGRIEGDSIIVASKQAGKIEAINVHEGDYVVAGQLLVVLDDVATRARTAEAEAAQDAARARAEQSQTEHTVLNQELTYSLSAAAAGVRAAEARLALAAAEEKQSRTERDRYQQLAAANLASNETAEQADLKWRQARDQVTAAEAFVQQAQEQLKIAQLGPARVVAKAAEVTAYVAAAKAAQARLEVAQSVLADLHIKSPAAGAVTLRLADIGEVINAGMPLLEIIDLDHLYLKVFISELDIGKVRLGLPAQIYIDAFSDTAFPAEVRSIAARAEFTPKEIQTADERVRQVYAVKLYLLDNPDHRMTPGLPADAVIRWQESVPWTKPRW